MIISGVQLNVSNLAQSPHYVLMSLVTSLHQRCPVVIVADVDIHSSVSQQELQ